DGAGDDLLELDLVRPGRHVRALAQVTAGDEVDGPLGRGSALARRGQGVDALGGGGHGAVPSWFMDACSARGDVVGDQSSDVQRAGPAGLWGPGPEPRWISIASKLGAGGRVVTGRSRQKSATLAMSSRSGRYRPALFQPSAWMSTLDSRVAKWIGSATCQRYIPKRCWET